MKPVATVLCLLFICVLSWLDRDERIRPSKALWIPVFWFLIIASRPVSTWLADIGLAPRTAATVDAYLEGSPLDRNIFLLLILSAFVVLLGRQQAAGALLGSNWLIVAFFAYCAVSVVWSEFPDVAFKRWFKALGDLLMILVVLTDPDRTGAIKRLLTRMAFPLLPLSVLYIKYYPEIGRAFSNSWTWMYRGVSSHKNSLGTLCLICGLAAIWRLFETYRDRQAPGRNKRLMAHSAVLVTVFYLFWVADSKTSMATFVLSGTFLVLTQSTSVFSRRWAVHLLMLGLPFGVLFAVFLDPSGMLLEAVGRDSTLTNRTGTWELVLGIAAEGNTLLGAGFESFWLGSRLESMWGSLLAFEGINQAHNGYIEVYLNLGWIGLTLLMVVLLNGYGRLLSYFSHEKLLGGLWLSYFLSTVIVNVTEAQFKLLTITWTFFLMGIMACTKRSPILVPSASPAEDPGARERFYPLALRSVRARSSF